MDLQGKQYHCWTKYRTRGELKGLPDYLIIQLVGLKDSMWSHRTLGYIKNSSDYTCQNLGLHEDLIGTTNQNIGL